MAPGGLQLADVFPGLSRSFAFFSRIPALLFAHTPTTQRRSLPRNTSPRNKASRRPALKRTHMPDTTENSKNNKEFMTDMPRKRYWGEDVDAEFKESYRKVLMGQYQSMDKTT